MNTDIAQQNLNTLKNLKSGVKLTVNSQGILSEDQRWLNGIRRTATGDSKKDLLEPIEETFLTFINSPDFNSDNGHELSRILEYLQTTFAQTYPNFQELQSKLENLIRENNSKVQEREGGRKLNLLLDRRAYSMEHDTLEFDPSETVLGLVKLHETGLSTENQEKFRKFYNNLYFDYSKKNGKSFDKRQYPRVIIYNTVLDVLGIDDSFRFRITGSEYVRIQKEFRELVQNFILHR